MGYYSVICWYGPLPIAPLIQVCGGELMTPGFEGAPPSKVVGQVLCGDAVEAVEPLLEAAVVGVDVVDVQVRRLRGSAFLAKAAIAFPQPPMR